MNSLFDKIYVNITRPAIFISCVAICVYYYIRNLGIFSSVFADELLYSNNIKYGLGTVNLYFFLTVYKSCSKDLWNFSSCFKGLSLFLHVLSSYIFYKSSQLYLGRSRPWVALWFLLLPLSNYSNWLMGETLFVFVLNLIVFTVLKWPNFKILHVFLFALLVMTKVIGAFFFVGYIFYSLINSRSDGWIKLLKNLVYLILSFIIIKFFLSLLLNGFDIPDSTVGKNYMGFPQWYANAINGSDTLKKIIFVFMGHIFFLLCIVPYIMLAARNVRKDWAQLLIFLFGYIFIISLFTVGWDGQSQWDTLERVHQRYYLYIFPYFFLACLKSIQTTASVSSKYSIYSTIAIIIVIAVCLYGSQYYNSSPVDSPDALILKSKYSYTFCILLIVSYLVGMQAFRPVYFIGFVAVSFVLQGMVFFVNDISLKSNSITDKFFLASQFINSSINKNDPVSLVSNNEWGLYKAAFYTNRLNVRLLNQTAVEKDPSLYLADHDGWVLFLDENNVSDYTKSNMNSIFSTNEFYVYQKK